MFSGATCAQQWQMPPTPEDLQAAYCFGLAKLTLPTEAGGDMAARLPPSERIGHGAYIAQQEANFKRLQGYMAGRLGVVDGSGLMIASKQAEADLSSALAAISNCAQSCASAPCNCATPPQIQSKIDRCKTLDFMPY